MDVLQHIILAHHGELSLGFGSARSPCTPEAWAVHMIENMDAKLTMALAACRSEPGEGRWTDVHKALGGKLFRPDVARDADLVLGCPGSAASDKAGGDAAVDGASDGVDLREVKLLNPLFEA